MPRESSRHYSSGYDQHYGQSRNNHQHGQHRSHHRNQHEDQYDDETVKYETVNDGARTDSSLQATYWQRYWPWSNGRENPGYSEQPPSYHTSQGHANYKHQGGVPTRYDQDYHHRSLYPQKTNYNATTVAQATSVTKPKTTAPSTFFNADDATKKYIIIGVIIFIVLILLVTAIAVGVVFGTKKKDTEKTGDTEKTERYVDVGLTLRHSNILYIPDFSKSDSAAYQTMVEWFCGPINDEIARDTIYTEFGYRINSCYIPNIREGSVILTLRFLFNISESQFEDMTRRLENLIQKIIDDKTLGISGLLTIDYVEVGDVVTDEGRITPRRPTRPTTTKRPQTTKSKQITKEATKTIATTTKKATTTKETTTTKTTATTKKATITKKKTITATPKETTPKKTTTTSVTTTTTPTTTSVTTTTPTTTIPDGLDECESSPCQNGGFCIDGDRSYKCICINEYSGDDCETAPTCKERGCDNGGTCITERRKYKKVWYESNYCECNGLFGGQFCEIRIDVCAGFPCLNGGTCMENENGYYCHCGEYSCFNFLAGPHCENVVNLTECQGRTNQTFPLRDSAHGYMLCNTKAKRKFLPCPADWIFNINTTFTSKEYCQDSRANTPECYYDITTMAPLTTTTVISCDMITCENGGTCLDTRTGFLCVCDKEYYGENCQTKKIHCSEVNCIHGDCEEIPETGFKCICTSGYDGDYCQKEKDECENDQCTGYPCENFFDGHTCDCGLCKCANFYTDHTRCWPKPGGCHNRQGLFPNNNDCTKYVECARGQFVTDHSCPRGQVFHPFLLNCAPYEQAKFCAESWYDVAQPWQDEVDTTTVESFDDTI